MLSFVSLFFALASYGTGARQKVQSQPPGLRGAPLRVATIVLRAGRHFFPNELDADIVMMPGTAVRLAAPSRILPLLAGDFNIRFGITNDSNWPGFGEHHVREIPAEASSGWADAGECALINSFYAQGGPTFFGIHGTKETSCMHDVLILPAGWVEA